MDLVSRVAAIARTASDLDIARRELDRLLRIQVGYDIGAFSTVDPATGLWTSCYVSGLGPDGARVRERTLFDLDIAGDVNAFSELSRTGKNPVATLLTATGGDVTRAARWAPLLSELGVVDELRAALVTEGQTWGALALYRTGSAAPFTPAHVGDIGAASSAMAMLLRLVVLRVSLSQPHALEAPPGAFTVEPDGAVHSVSASARAWLDVLDDRGRIPAIVQSVAASARTRGLAVAAVPSRAGGIVTLHGASIDDDPGAVAVIIEAARPALVSDLIAHAHALTGREREITGLAALGRSTREMARQLHISPFTVADHLKSVFTKVGVNSRAELVAALYYQHYERHSDRGATPAPYGWYLDHNYA
jgi:DNA-binding CsgD family transcriptional regulator